MNKRFSFLLLTVGVTLVSHSSLAAGMPQFPPSSEEEALGIKPSVAASSAASATVAPPTTIASNSAPTAPPNPQVNRSASVSTPNMPPSLQFPPTANPNRPQMAYPAVNQPLYPAMPAANAYPTYGYNPYAARMPTGYYPQYPAMPSYAPYGMYNAMPYPRPQQLPSLRPPVPMQNQSKEKKPWGDTRYIWPDFYTDSTNKFWDKMINAPSDMGYMPGGWRFPSLSSPDPVTVGDAVTNQLPPIMEEAGHFMNFVK